MLKGRGRLAQFGMLVADGAATAAGFLAAYYGVGVGLQRLSSSFLTVLPIGDYAWLPIAAAPMWWALFAIMGGYDLGRLRPSWTRGLAKPMVIGALIIGCAVFVLKEKEFARRVVGSFIVLNCAFIALGRWGIAAALRRADARRNLLLVGSAARAAEFVAAVGGPEWGLNVLGVVGPATNDQSSVPVLGSIGELPRLLDEMVVDDVIILNAVGGLEGVNEAIRVCEQVGVSAHVEAGFFDAPTSRPHVQSLDNLRLVGFSTGSGDPMKLAIKRGMDAILSPALMVVLSPALLLIALAVKLASRGPVLFRQVRVGLNGRRFVIYKFRSMRVGAEELRDEMAALNVADGPAFKATPDPRVTALGGFLRRHSLDELPQLWNVLKGDMSLVGPRPPLPSELPAYERWQRRRLSMRPGMTGLWQVSGRDRHSMSFADWMACDMRYIDEWSLELDVAILLRTLPAILGGKGM